MDFKEHTLSGEYLYQGKILKLKKDVVRLPDGKESVREVVEHSGGSAVYCEKDGKVLLVKQWRYPYKEEVLEIPAGKLNPNEDPELTAIRELEEEGGIKASKVKKVFDIYPSPGYTDEIIRIYKAEEFVETKAHLDEDEFLSALWIEKSELRKMLKNGEIKDGKTVIALLKFL